MDYPPFQDAVARFRSFLNDQGLHGSIGWLFPSDVLLVAGNWIIRPRPHEIVFDEVAIAYNQATLGRLGVRFNVLCLEGETIWSYIFYPADRTEAEYCMMPDGLKLSVPTSPRQCRRLSNEDEWSRLKAQDMIEHKDWMFK